MFKYLFMTLLGFSGSAWAQQAPAPQPLQLTDKNANTDILYQLGGGARMRYWWYDNGSAGALPNDEDTSEVTHRLQLDLRLDKGEYFQTYFRAINAGLWGDNSDERNQFLLQQAWGQWHVTDFLNLKFGRIAFETGRGLSFGANEWEDVPTYYDGFATLFDWDVMELSLYALKQKELDKAPNSVASDPEEIHYMVDVNFKELSDMISMADLSFVQVMSDVGQIPGTTLLTQKQRVQRFGFDVVVTGVYFEIGNTLHYITGSQDAGTGAGEVKVKQIMLDGEFKFIYPDWNQFQLWAGYHYDTGDDNGADDTNTQYEPLNYNLHNNAGRLDFFKFGNLSYLRSGFSFNFGTDYFVGSEFFVFQKTDTAGQNYLERGVAKSQFDSKTLNFGANKDLGQELDVWFGKKYPSGVNMELCFTMLMPGKAMDTAYIVASNTLQPMDDTIYNLYFQLGMFF